MRGRVLTVQALAIKHGSTDPFHRQRVTQQNVWTETLTTTIVPCNTATYGELLAL